MMERIPDELVYLVQSLELQNTGMGSGSVSVYVAKVVVPNKEYSLDDGRKAGSVFSLPDGRWMASQTLVQAEAGIPIGPDHVFPTEYEAVRYLVDNLPTMSEGS